MEGKRQRIKVFPVVHPARLGEVPTDAEGVVFSVLRQDGRLTFLGDVNHEISEIPRALVVVRYVSDRDEGFRRFGWVPDLLKRCAPRGLELIGLLECFGDEGEDLSLPTGPMPSQVANWIQSFPQTDWLFPWDLSEDVRAAARHPDYEALVGRTYFPEERSHGELQPFMQDINFVHLGSLAAGWIACETSREVLVCGDEAVIDIRGSLVDCDTGGFHMSTWSTAFFETPGLQVDEVNINREGLADWQEDFAPACVKEWIARGNEREIQLHESGVRRVTTSSATSYALSGCESLESVDYIVRSRNDWRDLYRLTEELDGEVQFNLLLGFYSPIHQLDAEYFLEWVTESSRRSLSGLTDDKLLAAIDHLKSADLAVHLDESIALWHVANSPFNPFPSLASPRAAHVLRAECRERITNPPSFSCKMSFCAEAEEVAQLLESPSTTDRDVDILVLKKSLEWNAQARPCHLRDQVMWVGGVDLGAFLASKDPAPHVVESLQEAIDHAGDELSVRISTSFHESSLSVPHGWEDWYVRFFWFLARACRGRVGKLRLEVDSESQALSPLFCIRGVELFESLEELHVTLGGFSPSEELQEMGEKLPHGELPSQPPELRFLRGAARQGLKALTIQGSQGILAAPTVAEDFRTVLPANCELKVDPCIFHLSEYSEIRCLECGGRSFVGTFESDWYPLASFFRVTVGADLPKIELLKDADSMVRVLNLLKDGLDGLEIESFEDLSELEDRGAIELSSEIASASGIEPRIESIQCQACGTSSDQHAAKVSRLLTRTFDDECDDAPLGRPAEVRTDAVSWLSDYHGKGKQFLQRALEAVCTADEAQCPDCQGRIWVGLDTVFCEVGQSHASGECYFTSDHPVHGELVYMNSNERGNHVQRREVDSAWRADHELNLRLTCEGRCWEIVGPPEEFTRAIG